MMAKVVEFPGASQAQSVITEDAVAELVVREHGENIRFCPEMGKWLKWSGLRWEVDETGQVFELAKDVCRLVTVQTGKDKWGAHRTVKSVEAFLRTRQELVVRAAQLDADAMKLGTPSGYVDLETGRAMKPDKRVHITKTAAVDPARAGTVPTKWLAFLDQATASNAELKLYLQRMAGYILTGQTIEQCLFFVYGPGGNGKSVFINTLAGIMGDYARTATMDALHSSKDSKHTTDIAYLMGARLVTSNETEEGKAWAEARLKQMTGSDSITARFINKNNFTFRPEFKLLVIGNHKPTLTSVDDAMRRRFNIIPFTNKPKEVNAHLEEELRAEWPAIMRWMIDGCTDWQSDKLGKPAVIQAETGDYFADQDAIGQWLKETVSIVDQKLPIDHRERINSTKMYASWIAWTKENGEPPGTHRSFSDQLVKRGFYKKRNKTGVWFMGVHMLTQTEKDRMENDDDE